MKARDVMTSEIVSVRHDVSVRDIAQLLLDKGISAVPVVDDRGAPIGMVSEGDLIGRGEAEREARRGWWLAIVSRGDRPNADFFARIDTAKRAARDIMSAPIVAVSEETDVTEIARLLTAYRIKRVPVVQDGHIVGIVSRANLLRALAVQPQERPAAVQGGLFASAFTRLDEHLLHRKSGQEIEPVARPERGQVGVMVTDFQRLVADFEETEVQPQAAPGAAPLSRA